MAGGEQLLLEEHVERPRDTFLDRVGEGVAKGGREINGEILGVSIIL